MRRGVLINEDHNNIYNNIYNINKPLGRIKKEEVTESQTEKLIEFAENILSSLWAKENKGIVASWKEDKEDDSSSADPLTKFTAEEIVDVWNSVSVPLWRKFNKENKNTKIWRDFEALWRKRKLEYTQEQFFSSLENYIADIKDRNPKTDYSRHRFTLYEWIKQSNAMQKFASI